MNHEVLEIIRLLSGYFVPVLLFTLWVAYLHISNYKNKKKLKKGDE